MDNALKKTIKDIVNKILYSLSISLSGTIFFFVFEHILKKDITIGSTIIDHIYNELLILILLFVFFFLSSFIFFITKSYIKYKNDYIINTLNHSSLSTNKSLMNITENISHELSTPLEIINFKMFKFLKIVENIETQLCESSCNSCPSSIKYISAISNVRSDFKYVESSLEQITNILNKMRGFKSIKYSNGNKTMYDVIETAFTMMTISHKNFDWYIDEEFKKYNLSCPKCLSNADLLNILINHIKNSIEAKSTKITAGFISYKNGYVTILLKDNGNGIPEKFIPYIFKPNLSTKSNVLNTRGNGMYINLEILKSVGGDLKLLDTSKRGTLFKITIKANKK